MDAEPGPLVLSIYELGPFPAPVPSYDGPSSWQTDNILRALKTIARRMYTAEDTLASTKASENWENGPDTKNRRSGDVSNSPITPISSNGPTASGYSTTTDVNMSESGSDQEPSSHHSAHFPDRATSPMRISLDGLPSAVDRSNGSLRAAEGSSLSAPPTSHGDLLLCPVCGNVGDMFSAIQASSPLVVPPGGPLATAAFESGMSAIEELRLLKAQVQDIARVCNAVARGDLSQKITVPVQDSANLLGRLLVSSRRSALRVNSVVRLWCSMSKVFGSS